MLMLRRARARAGNPGSRKESGSHVKKVFLNSTEVTSDKRY